MKCFALIPSGGKSTRMGRPKLALELGSLSLLERVAATMRDAGVADVLVVLGPHLAELAELAARAGTQSLLLREETPDMRATIEAGLAWLEEHHHPDDADCWLLAPADHPALDAKVIRQLLEAAADHPASVVVPGFAGKRGHPALVPWTLGRELRELPAGQGLNRLFRAHPGRVIEIAAGNADVLIDLNTPEEYERFRSRFEKGS